MTPAEDREELRRALLDDAFKPGEGWRRNGRPLEWSIDCREIALNARLLPKLGNLLWYRLRSTMPDGVAGPEVSGTPLVAGVLFAGIQESVNLGGFVVRSAPKQYGRRKQIEGRSIRRGERIVIVDDVASTGSEILSVAETLRAHGAQVSTASVVVDAQMGAPAALERAGIELRPLFKLSDLGIRTSLDPAPRSAPTWTYGPTNMFPSTVPYSSPVIVGELIVLGTDAGSVLGLTLDGRRVWHTQLPAAVGGNSAGIYSSPKIMDGIAYFGANDGYIYALSVKDGEILWRQRCGWRVGSTVALWAGGQRLFVEAADGGNSGALLAFSTASGSSLWRRPLAGYAHASPGVHAPSGTVIAGDNAGMISGFDVETGKTKWMYETQGAVKGRITVDDLGRCYTGSFDGNLYVLDVTNGRLVWNRRLSRRLYCTPFVSGRCVIVGGTSHIACLERETGSVRWWQHTGGSVRGGAKPFPGDNVAVACGDGRVLIIDVQTGTVRRILQARGQIICSPAVSKSGVLVAPSTDGLLCGWI